MRSGFKEPNEVVMMHAGGVKSNSLIDGLGVSNPGQCHIYLGNLVDGNTCWGMVEHVY